MTPVCKKRESEETDSLFEFEPIYKGALIKITFETTH